MREFFGFTDGNLNRHLKVLVDEGWVRATRTGAGRGSKTTIGLTSEGQAGLREMRAWVRKVDRLLSSGPDPRRGGALSEMEGVVDDRSRGWVG